MSEKLDLFELSVKRGFENYEVPMEEGAWNQFQSNMNNGTGSSSAGGSKGSFFGKFGVAAAILTATGLFINYSTDFRQDQLADASVEHIESTRVTEHLNDAIDIESTFTVNATSEISNEEVLLSESETFTKKAATKKAEEKRILTINKKLQAAADRVEKEAEALEKKTTTRYVGKNFNLDAISEFSPNGDGKNDVFVPSALTTESRFNMTITNAKGQRVFNSKSLEHPWDGRDLEGNTAAAGHYSWEVILHKDNNNKEIFRGVVRLDR